MSIPITYLLAGCQADQKSKSLTEPFTREKKAMPEDRPAEKAVTEEPNSENDNKIGTAVRKPYLNKFDLITLPQTEEVVYDTDIPLVINTYPFNGATVEGDAKVSSLTFYWWKDGGVAYRLNRITKGTLTFSYKGKAESSCNDGTFSVMFIKSDPNDDYEKDKILEEKMLAPSRFWEKTAELKIPEGTDKIVIMLVGEGTLYLRLREFSIKE